MDLTFLGCRKDKIEQLNNKNIFSLEDLVKWLPRTYHDFRIPKTVREIKDGEILSMHLMVYKIEEKPTSRGTNMVIVKCKDANSDLISINYFNATYVLKNLRQGESYLFCGKVSLNLFAGREYWTMTNPFRFSQDIQSLKRIFPVYKKVKGMSDDFLINAIQQAVVLIDKDDYLEHSLQKDFGLLSYSDAISEIHAPMNPEGIENAKRRYLFDDLFFFNFNLREKYLAEARTSEYRFRTYPTVRKYLATLPFQLTEGQNDALRKIGQAAKEGRRVNALVSGDVGSGKTEVAKLSMLMAYDSGYQSVMMAPTNVLAKQHYADLVKSFEPLGIKVAFLAGDTKVSEKKKLYKAIESGEIHMVIGTSAVISKEVVYDKLALTVVDEEHRFGVVQREALKEKAMEGVHCVSMSATPIPRTLAMSLYGDSIDVLTINSMPLGRKPIQTFEMDNDDDVNAFLAQEIQKGHQAYVVCPLIEESDNEKIADVESVEVAYKKLCNYFDKLNIKVSMVSGKMKQAEIDEALADFAANKSQILVSTTIIEVGVNIPNTTVICLKNAERFGLAQMHQLRGRVGRNSLQSYCILQLGTRTEIAIKKAETMCTTNDGYVIAQKDLELRGTGDFIGTSQSGENKYVMLMLANPDLNAKIKESIKSIFDDKERKALYVKKMALH